MVGIWFPFQLQVLQSHHQGACQERVDADTVFPGLCLEIVHGNLETGQVEKTAGIDGLPQFPSIVFLAAGAEIACVFLEAVFHFRFRRFFQPAQYTAGGGNLDPVFLLQIFCNQTLQKYQGAISVGQGVEHFQSDAIAVGNDAESASTNLVTAHFGDGIAVFRLNLGRIL